MKMWKNVNKTNSPSSPLDTKTQNTCVSESLATKSHDMKRGKINVRLMFGFRASCQEQPLRLNDNLRAIEVGIPVGLIQRCALLGSARILRKVLEMKKEEKKQSWGVSWLP